MLQIVCFKLATKKGGCRLALEGNFRDRSVKKHKSGSWWALICIKKYDKLTNDDWVREVEALRKHTRMDESKQHIK